MTDTVGTAYIDLRARGRLLATDIERTTNRAVQEAERRLKGPTIAPTVDEGKMTAAFSRLGVVADKELGAVASRSNLARRSMDLLGTAGVAMAGPVGVAVAAVGALVAVTAGGISKFVALASEIRRFRAVTGDTAEDASRFVVALRAMGLEPEIVARALFRLQAQLGAGQQPLREFGIELRAAGGSKDLLFQVADAIQATTDQSQRARIAQAAFGRQGQALLPILQRNRDALEEFFTIADSRGQAFTDKDLADAAAYSRALRGLKDSTSALAISTSRDLVPTIAALARGLAAVVDKANSASRAGGGLGGVLRAALIPVTFGASEGLRRLGDSHKAAGDAAEAQAEQERELIRRLEEADKELQDQATALFGLADAHEAVENAEGRDRAARLKLIAAQNDFNEVGRRGGEIAENQRKAVDALRQATQALTDAEQRSVDTAFRVGQARRDLAIANLEAGTGSNRALKAQKELNDALFDQRRGEEEITDARSKKADAQRAVNEAARAGGEGSPEQLEAFFKLIEAQKETERTARALALARVADRAATDAANKIVDSATTKLGFFREEIDRIRTSTSDGVVANALKVIADEIDRIMAATPVGLVVTQPNIPAAGTSSLGGAGTVGSGGLATGAAGAAALQSTSSLTIVNNFSQPIDTAQAAELNKQQAAGVGGGSTRRL